MDDESSTHRERASMIDACEFLCPNTIGDQLRQQGSQRLNFRTTPDGRDEPTPITYPPAGNAGFDTDHDADDYNWAAQQQSDAVTSSSGPP
jgi:hypothetical protein